ncbi:hypothetical protein PsorP6_002284 [Peronosclerospora sorghi]|uniref:Uncharacterized protein n=1 Tax=Peronosclerospora sorghi TaxID=230839 RepID=A0ACC0WS71_9STRA|nr:hypothetical protein PsorP6_002284 [Peronosclerospora sorghi]
MAATMVATLIGLNQHSNYDQDQELPEPEYVQESGQMLALRFFHLVMTASRLEQPSKKFGSSPHSLLSRKSDSLRNLSLAMLPGTLPSSALSNR